MATALLTTAIAFLAFAFYCGSLHAATSPIRAHAEWAGALAGYLGVLLLLAAAVCAVRGW